MTVHTAEFPSVTSTETLWDWRRRISDLYSAVRMRQAADPRAAWGLWRETREALFRQHPQSPLETGCELPRYFDYDPTLRFVVPLDAVEADASERLPAGHDGDVRLSAFARTRGLADALGQELTLYWIGGYGGGVFLPFRDGTSGKETYGGGRYLLDTIKSADLGTLPDGRAILDFNFAYNPSCAYSPRWECPLAPRANWLPNRVQAGERG